ncbi:hypothetical protein [Acetobacter sp. UBA5411]|uniref:hypothetical protein n=1 Tax=Acetobacter sp. UBA5411 TaxID=1945905 RepID=UPI0025BB5137|nr:hypothetical protein [Acetobacter sp. UBA5411]
MLTAHVFHQKPVREATRGQTTLKGPVGTAKSLCDLCDGGMTVRQKIKDDAADLQQKILFK